MAAYYNHISGFNNAYYYITGFAGRHYISKPHHFRILLSPPNKTCKAICRFFYALYYIIIYKKGIKNRVQIKT